MANITYKPQAIIPKGSIFYKKLQTAALALHFLTRQKERLIDYYSNVEEQATFCLSTNPEKWNFLERLFLFQDA